MKNYKLTSKKTNQTLFAGFYPDIKSCLEDAINRRTALPHVDLRTQNLSNANLDDGIFPHADFSGANLTGANISESYCRHANFNETALYNTCFAYSTLSMCNFKGAHFGATDMSGAIIDGAQFNTLSAFTIDFTKTKQMQGCTFINNTGQIAQLSAPPIIINGISKSPIIMLGDHIYRGHKRLDHKHAQHLLAAIANLHTTINPNVKTDKERKILT